MSVTAALAADAVMTAKTAPIVQTRMSSPVLADLLSARGKISPF
jgi:hypothetical protein